VFTHCFYKKFLRCSFITPPRDVTFKNFPFMINGAPKVKSLTVYFHKDFVQMPLPVRMLTHPLLSDFLSKFCTKPIHPKPYSFVSNIYSTFMQDIFNLAKTQRIANVIHHCQADDFGARLEVFKGVLCCHPETLNCHSARFKSVSSNSAVCFSMNVVECLLTKQPSHQYHSYANESSL